MKLYHAQNEEDHRTCAGSHHPQREIPVQPQNSPQSKRLLPWKWAADAVAGRVSRRWGLATANCSPLPQEEIQIRPRHRLLQSPVSSSRQSSFHSHTRFSAASTLSQEEPRTPTNKATKHPNQTLHHSRNMYRGRGHFWRENKGKIVWSSPTDLTYTKVKESSTNGVVSRQRLRRLNRGRFHETFSMWMDGKRPTFDENLFCLTKALIYT